MSAFIMTKILELYFPAGGVIADLTYGKGNFWRQLDKKKYMLLASDLVPKAAHVKEWDFRSTQLPYPEEHCDMVVLDPF